jgi:hypothetical protein
VQHTVTVLGTDGSVILFEKPVRNFFHPVVVCTLGGGVTCSWRFGRGYFSTDLHVKQGKDILRPENHTVVLCLEAYHLMHTHCCEE